MKLLWLRWYGTIFCILFLFSRTLAVGWSLSSNALLYLREAWKESTSKELSYKPGLPTVQWKTSLDFSILYTWGIKIPALIIMKIKLWSLCVLMCDEWICLNAYHLDVCVYLNVNIINSYNLCNGCFYPWWGYIQLRKIFLKLKEFDETREGHTLAFLHSSLKQVIKSRAS